MSGLIINNLKAGYSKPVFENLNTKVPGKGLFTILGKNGSGKSTLLKCIAQQLEYEGYIKWNDFDLGTLSVKKRADFITYLHQSSSVTLNIKVSELIVMGKFRQKSIFGDYDKADYQEVEHLLNQLGLIKYKDSYLQDLSGGEQQLIWICQSLIQNTPIILFDEPTTFLDLRNKRIVFDLIKSLTKEKLVVLVSHDIEYIGDLEGLFINLSHTEQVIENISKDKLKEHRNILEMA